MLCGTRSGGRDGCAQFQECLPFKPTRGIVAVGRRMGELVLLLLLLLLLLGGGEGRDLVTGIVTDCYMCYKVRTNGQTHGRESSGTNGA